MLENILKLNGRFIGRGINHEGLPFTGVFTAKPAALGSGLLITFDANGDDGRNYHGETSLIGKNIEGKTGLWVLSSNHPGIFERTLKDHKKSESASAYIFGFGKNDDRSIFREEILIEIGVKSVKYVYSWGLPNGDFAERSGCTMELVS